MWYFNGPKKELTEEERQAALKKMFEENYEEFPLSNIISVDYCLQCKCAHCSSGREDADECNKRCFLKNVTDRLEALLQKYYQAETGESLPYYNMYKCIDRKVLAIEGMKSLRDCVFKLPLQLMFDAESCFDDMCAHCKECHPDRMQKGKCKECYVAEGKKCLEIQGDIDGNVTSDGLSLNIRLPWKLDEF